MLYIYIYRVQISFLFLRPGSKHGSDPKVQAVASACIKPRTCVTLGSQYVIIPIYFGA